MTAMESKPVITYGGDKTLFGSLEIEIIQGLPSEPIEWRRSFGRAPKTVYVEAQFISLKEENLPDEVPQTLMGQPFLHTFWTDCPDVDTYKATVKDDITIWLTKLKLKNVQDWLIVLVEGSDNRKGGKAKILPRASVLDKIRNDFCSKQPDRCITLLRSDSRGAESWQGLLYRLRHLLLQAYNRNLGRFEENMRSQRERRNEAGWNFCDYFLLQEELAFVFEMLGIYDEALVQYDELDALFTQFVINSNSGDTPNWLTAFSRPCVCWEGLSLSPTVATEKRKLIREGTASLLDLRNYLFSRQCALLLLMFRPWEVAQRSLTFMHSCLNELNILEVELPTGAVACWVFLSCLEILQTCERFNDSSHVTAYSLYTAGLWAYARSKLQELGEMCGLMPDKEATSQQLHHVVELVAGMGSDQNIDNTSPLAKLKEALSSKEAFQRHYLELSELAISTYKHIGRIRSARLIGKDLAEFYMTMGEPQKASSFLVDALKTFQEERWPLLISQTQTQIARCYDAMGDKHKYIKMALLVASDLCFPEVERVNYFDSVLLKLEEMEDGNEKLDMNLRDIIKVKSVEMVAPNMPYLTVDSTVKVKLVVCSRLPKKFTCGTVIVSLVKQSDDVGSQDAAVPKSFEETVTIVSDPGVRKPSLTALDLRQNFVFQEDRSLMAASIICQNTQTVLRRQDSHATLTQNKSVSPEDFTSSVMASDVTFNPGDNEVILSCKAEAPGNFTLTQLIIRNGALELVQPKIFPRVTYRVVYEPPTVTLNPVSAEELLAGVSQDMTLVVKSGSNPIEKGTKMKLKASAGLKLMEAKEESKDQGKRIDELDVTLPNVAAFECCSFRINLLVQLGPRTDASTIRSEVVITSSVCPEPVTINLQFVPPFMTFHRLFTVSTRKFIQITVHGLHSEEFELEQPNLKIENDVVTVNSLNFIDQNLYVRIGQTASYMWEMVFLSKETTDLNMEFTLKYQLRSAIEGLSQEPRDYKYSFSVNDLRTLFCIHAKLEPKGSEFFRTGNMCYMNVQITRVNPSDCNSLMYEVTADQTSWAVCGRTAGVVSMDSTSKHSVVLDVMPLTSGFLPLPYVRLSKYIPADQTSSAKDSPKKVDTNSGSNSLPRLEPFTQGQVYNWSEALQVHVIPAPGTTNELTVP